MGNSEITPSGDSTRSLAELAEALFCSPLRIDCHPDPDQVRAAVHATLLAHNNDPRLCACHVGQMYGDYPDVAVPRMRWCLQTVAQAFGVGVAVR